MIPMALHGTVPFDSNEVRLPRRRCGCLRSARQGGLVESREFGWGVFLCCFVL